MTLYFHYNANKFSLQNQKFADKYITEVGCAYNEINDTVYECAILDNVEQIFANANVATILATLADHMYEWSDYKQVNNKTELMTLINKTLAYYGENIDSHFGKDDWDDYIVMLLEAEEVLGKTYISEDDIRHFSTSLWEDREL